MLEADVEVTRRDFTLRAGISVEAGGRLALFGPSGAGKTTLLEAIAGLTPARGRVRLADRELNGLPSWRRRVGLLRQDPGLFPHLSVRANLGYSRAAEPGDLERLAESLGIGSLLGERPARLSGGQQHRVALGRLLLAHCDALLLDEPFSGLDLTLRRSLTDLVVRLVTERQIPAVLVAHELTDAQAFADRLAVLDHGSLLQTGDPDEVIRRPASRRVAALVGYPAFVAADGLIAAIHPERVSTGSLPAAGLVLSGDVLACRPAGAGWEVDLRVGSDTVVVCRLAERPSGSRLVVTALDPPWFGPDGRAVDRSAVGAPAARAASA